MSKNILVADDNPSIRSRICRLVESEGFAVCAEAANGIEAIEMAHKFQPNLILIDLTMPVMNGAEAATILKKELPHIPIILFTMHEDSLNTTLASEIGVDKVIRKSEAGKLVDSMREVLGLPPKDTGEIGPLTSLASPRKHRKRKPGPTI